MLEGISYLISVERDLEVQCNLREVIHNFSLLKRSLTRVLKR